MNQISPFSEISVGRQFVFPEEVAYSLQDFKGSPSEESLDFPVNIYQKLNESQFVLAGDLHFAGFEDEPTIVAGKERVPRNPHQLVLVVEN